MTHMEWGLIMVAAALVLGGLASGPVWYAAGNRRGRRDGAWETELEWEAELDRAVERHPAGNGRHAGPDLDALELPARTELPYLASPVVFGGYAAEPVPVPVPADERELLMPGEHVMFYGHTRVAHEDQALAVANEEPDALTDSQFTAAMAAQTTRFIAGLIGDTDELLKEITR